jgi:hypothetical protein
MDQIRICIESSPRASKLKIIIPMILEAKLKGKGT